MSHPEPTAMSAVSTRLIAQVLAGDRQYDDVPAQEQSVVRAEWSRRAADRRQKLNLADIFGQEGRSFVELDDERNLVRHPPRDEAVGRG